MEQEIIIAGPLRVRLGEVAAFLYRHLAERPPEPVMVPVLDQDGQPTRELVESPQSMAAFNAWASAPGDNPITLERTRMFLIGFGALLDRVQRIVDDFPNRARMTNHGWETKVIEEDIQFEFYDAAKATFGTEKAEIREFFKYAYVLVNQTPNGSRWGQYVTMLGVDTMIGIVRGRFEDVEGDDYAADQR